LRGFRRSAFVLGQAGQSFVEVGLLLPVLALMMVGGLDLARAYSSQAAVENASRAGAEAKQLGQSCTSGAGGCPAAIDEVSRVPGLNPVEVTCTVGTPTPPANSYCVTVSTDATYFSVRVQYTFQTLIDWKVLTRTVGLDRTTKFRSYP